MCETPFPNRTSKHRAVRKLKLSLPETPQKRTATIQSYLETSKSPTVRTLIKNNIIRNPEEEEINLLATNMLKDVKTVVQQTKHGRKKDKLQSVNSVFATVSGENVARSNQKIKLAKALGVPCRTITKGHRIRTCVLKTEKSSWQEVNSKTRGDAIAQVDKENAYNFWLKPTVSRPTGNKKDVKRNRIGYKTYTSHMIHILEKSQAEVFNDFKKSYPNVKMSLKSFERCKPYFVRAVRCSDRQTCCCRYHTEINGLFKQCMKFRKQVLDSKSEEEKESVQLFDKVSKLCDITLCDTENYNNLKCIQRTCSTCGVKLMKFLPEETARENVAENVQWEKFEYCSIKGKGGKNTRKLMLVKKETNPAEMFQHLKDLVHTFPLHQQTARWQHEQFQYVAENLSQDACLCVHDFSENYKCSEKTELQSTYFQKTEVTIHVTVIHRHSILSHDGIASTPEQPNIRQEYMYVISPDTTHDQYFVHEVRRQVKQYLDDIGIYFFNKIFHFKH